MHVLCHQDEIDDQKGELKVEIETVVHGVLEDETKRGKKLA
jgi:hypothetical protein